MVNDFFLTTKKKNKSVKKIDNGKSFLRVWFKFFEEIVCTGKFFNPLLHFTFYPFGKFLSF